MAKATVRYTRSRPRKHSVVANVNSGLMLVKKRKSRGKLATLNDYAKTNFEAWKPRKDGQFFPTANQIDLIFTSGRIAHGLLLKSRDELIEVYNKIDADLGERILADIFQAAETAKALAQMMEAAETRFLVAGSAAEMSKKKRAA